MKRLIVAVCFVLVVMPARAQYAELLRFGSVPGLTNQENAQVRKIAQMMAFAKGRDQCAKEAQTALDAAETTRPVFRHALATVLALAAAADKTGELSASDLAALYDDPNVDKVTVAYCLPLAMARAPKDQRLAMLDDMERRLSADGSLDKLGYRVITIMARAVYYSEAGDWENEIAALERLGEVKEFRDCDGQRLLKDKNWLFVPKKRVLLQNATSDQILRVAGICDQWATLLEKNLGHKPEAYAVITQMRAQSNECKRLVTVKKAAAEAAAKMAQ